MKYIKHYVHYLHSSKSYLRQAVWGHYILIHFETFYKENKRDLQHQGKQATRIIIRMNMKIGI